MPNQGATKYFMGDVYVGDVSYGFLVSDSRASETETTIDEKTARAIVEATENKIDAPFQPATLFEISQEEFELFRDTEIYLPGLEEGLSLWQVKS